MASDEPTVKSDLCDGILTETTGPEPPVKSVYQSTLQDSFEALLTLTESLAQLELALEALTNPADFQNVEVIGADSPDQLVPAIKEVEQLISLARNKLKGCQEVLLVKDRRGLNLIQTLIVDGFYLAPKVCCESFLATDADMAELVSHYNFNIEVTSAEGFLRALSATTSASGRE